MCIERCQAKYDGIFVLARLPTGSKIAICKGGSASNAMCQGAIANQPWLPADELCMSDEWNVMYQRDREKA